MLGFEERAEMFEMTLEVVYFAAILLTGVSVVSLFYGLQRAIPETPDDVRTYMDPLPAGLKLIWPFVFTIYRLSRNALLKFLFR